MDRRPPRLRSRCLRLCGPGNAEGSSEDASGARTLGRALSRSRRPERAAPARTSADWRKPRGLAPTGARGRRLGPDRACVVDTGRVGLPDAQLSDEARAVPGSRQGRRRRVRRHLLRAGPGRRPDGERAALGRTVHASRRAARDRRDEDLPDRRRRAQRHARRSGGYVQRRHDDGNRARDPEAGVSPSRRGRARSRRELVLQAHRSRRHGRRAARRVRVDGEVVEARRVIASIAALALLAAAPPVVPPLPPDYPFNKPAPSCPAFLSLWTSVGALQAGDDWDAVLLEIRSDRARLTDISLRAAIPRMPVAEADWFLSDPLDPEVSAFSV